MITVARCLFLFLLLLSIGSFAQSQTRNGGDGILYVATDKTLYLPGETIWFSGLLLPVTGADSGSRKADILSVALLREDTIGYTLKKNYLVEAGVCAGSFTLPGELMPGNYELVAALNLVDGKQEPYYSFRKLITVKSPLVQPFAISAELDSNVRDTLLVNLHAKLPDSWLVTDKRATVTSQVYGRSPMTLELPKTGYLTIRVPKNTINKTMPVLYTTTSINGSARRFNVWLAGRVVIAATKGTKLLGTLPVGKIRLSIQQPLAGDTLSASISSEFSKKVRLVTKNVPDGRADTSAAVAINGSRKVIIPLQAFARGIYKLTVIDEQGNISEPRYFYAHYSGRSKINIEPSRQTYGLREKVNVTVSLFDREGNPQQGLITFRCVNLSRLRKQHLVKLPAFYKAAIEDQLAEGLTGERGPAQNSRHAGNHMIESGDTLIKKMAKGLVVRATDSSAVYKPVTIILKKGDLVSISETDSAGTFVPLGKQFVIPEGSAFSMKAIDNVKSNNPDAYAIHINDPMQAAMAFLQRPQIYEANIKSSIQADSMLLFKNKYEGNQLRAVTVKGKRSELASDVFYANQCGDYVGPCHILNCQVHFGDKKNTLPIKGEKYSVLVPAIGNSKTGWSYGTIVYQGCTNNKLNMIYVGRTFEGFSRKRSEDAETAYLSTLYWQPSLVVKGRKELEFYTSDLPGTYQIILEGINELGEAIYQESTITVKR